VGKERQTRCVAFAPDGATIATGETGAIVFWDRATCRRKSAIDLRRGHSYFQLAFARDGKTLAAADANHIQLYDVAARDELQHLSHSGQIKRFALSPDGSTIVACTDAGTAPVWAVATGRLLRELPCDDPSSAVAFAPDGKTVAVGERGSKQFRWAISLWDVAAGARRRRIERPGWFLNSVAFSPDGRTVIAGCDFNVVRLWDAATGDERTPARGQPFHVGLLATDPGGRLLAYTKDYDVQLYDLATGRDLGTLPGDKYFLTSLAFAPDGKTLAVGMNNSAALWDVPSRTLLRRLGQHPIPSGTPLSPYTGLSFAPDGRTLFAPGTDGLLQSWDVATGRELRPISLNVGESRTPGFSAAITPDGSILGASYDAGGLKPAVRFWDASTGRVLPHLAAGINAWCATVPEPRLPPWKIDVRLRLVFSPDGKMMVAYGSPADLPVWEVSTGRERCRLAGQLGPTAAAAFSPDSRTLATSGEGNTIRLWDLKTGTELSRLTGHRDKAYSLAFSADGGTLISAGVDTTVLFWDVAAVTRRERRPERLPLPQWESLWTELAGDDAAKAFGALDRLAADPETVARLNERLRPAAAPDPQRLAQLIGDLGDERFAVREAASRELERLGESARPELESAKARPGASPESRVRVDRLLDRLGLPSGERLRELRAVELLERLGTPAARQVLRALAAGAPGARLTREATLALGRLARRPAATP
jgi:WD40 repeat protein